MSKLDKDGVVRTVFLDLKNNFDSSNHEIVLATLNIYNETIYWIKSYLHNCSQSVRLGDS